MSDQDPASLRKDTHLNLASSSDAASGIPAGFDRVRLTHIALPEISLDEVDIGASYLGTGFEAPFMIGAMTGGTRRGNVLNEVLIAAAAEAGIPFCLGSQRASLEAGLDQGYLRKAAPGAFVVGNLGALQLVQPDGPALALAAIEAVEANALAIHLNPLQEAVQPEGGSDWRGVLTGIEELARSAPVPIVVKEVGAGLSAAMLQRLRDAGVAAAEIAGLGGTNWTRIETLRQPEENRDRFRPFADWGNPTVETLLELRDRRAGFDGMAIVGSGGVRNGLDVAKAIWLGADMAAAAQPFLRAGLDKPEEAARAAVRELIGDWKAQLRLALFLTGSRNIAAFRNADGSVRA